MKSLRQLMLYLWEEQFLIIIFHIKYFCFSYVLLDFEKDLQAVVTFFTDLSLLNKMEKGLWIFFSILYYVHCTVFKQSKSTLTELSTIYNRNVGRWFSNPLSREAIVFCYSMPFYRMLICIVDHGLHVSPHLQISSKTFAFMQANFTFFLLSFSTIFLTLPFLKNVFCLWNKAIYYSHKWLSNAMVYIYIV